MSSLQLRASPCGRGGGTSYGAGWKAILKKGKNLGVIWMCSAGIRLRIQVKKLRYAAEFFGCVFPGKKSSFGLVLGGADISW